MAIPSAKKRSSDMREASEFVQRRLDWILGEWEARGDKNIVDPDATEMMSNIMAEVSDILRERFDFKMIREDGWFTIELCGLYAGSRRNLRTALHAWVSRARLRLSVEVEETAEPVARAA